MLFGIFHFQDAGLDTVKAKDIDIFTEENQAYLEALTQRLQGFKPTRVLLEYSPENDALINERYRGVEWKAEAMYEYAEQHDSPEMGTFNEIIETYTVEDEQARTTMTLKELLQRLEGVAVDPYF